jgi:hypothetical protein
MLFMKHLTHGKTPLLGIIPKCMISKSNQWKLMNHTAAIMAGRLIIPSTNAHMFTIANACTISVANMGTSNENAPINRSKRRRKQPSGESARCITSRVSACLPPGPSHEPPHFYKSQSFAYESSVLSHLHIN